MKTLYCVVTHLHGTANNPNLKLLKTACENLGIDFVTLPTPSAGFMFSEVPELGNGGLYLLNTKSECFEYAYALIKKNPQLKHFYDSEIVLSPRWRELINDDAANVSIIPTLYSVPAAASPELIEKIETKLGGFPVILKQSGGSHGTGVMMIDSAISLKTVLPHVILDRPQDFVLKKFVKNARNYRVITLDGEVTSAIFYPPLEGDIRSNAINDLHPQKVELRPEWGDVAVAATRQKGVRFGGVDLLVDDTDTAWVAEVNTPCNFSRAELLTGDPIASKIVQYLCS